MNPPSCLYAKRPALDFSWRVFFLLTSVTLFLGLGSDAPSSPARLDKYFNQSSCLGLDSNAPSSAARPDNRSALFSPAQQTAGKTSIGKNEFIHVYVALCDNESQGIVPVPKAIGNGNDPDNNLYWGCGYGVRTYFSKKSPEWQWLNTAKPKQGAVLERCLFKHKRTGTYMVAEAYRGLHIKHCINQFILSAAGKREDSLSFYLKNDTVTLNMNKEKLIVYVGHDGLMEFAPDSLPANKAGKKNDVMILACTSKTFFKEAIKTAGANPVLWTTNLMSPEAYSLKAALDGYLLNETGQQIRIRAATAYDKYLKCGIKGATNLFATGF